MVKAILYIDGENFRKSVERVFRGLSIEKLDINGLFNFLIADSCLVASNYYVAKTGLF